eukprot:UN19657
MNILAVEGLLSQEKLVQNKSTEFKSTKTIETHLGQKRRCITLSKIVTVQVESEGPETRNVSLWINFHKTLVQNYYLNEAVQNT